MYKFSVDFSPLASHDGKFDKCLYHKPSRKPAWCRIENEKKIWLITKLFVPLQPNLQEFNCKASDWTMV